MSFLSEAHDQWHAMNGRYAVCDLDCGASEYIGQAFEDDYEDTEGGTKGIRCGSCKGRHSSVSMVKLCYEVKRDLARSDPWAGEPLSERPYAE